MLTFKFYFLIILIMVTLLISKVFGQDYPSSSNLGLFPTGTGMEINQGGGFKKNDTYYFSDKQVLHFKKTSKNRVNFKHKGFGWNGYQFSSSGKTLYPRTQKISDNLYFQETEVTNLEWKEFLFFVRLDSGEQYYLNMLPDQNRLPCNNYFYDDFYNLYPLVGISYEQAKEYCLWKTGVANLIFEVHNQKNIQLTFRLPTLKEWQSAATNIEYDNVAIVKISSDSYDYIKKQLNLKVSGKEVKNKISVFNKSNKAVYPLHCLQDWGPFKIQDFPQYVYSFPHNHFKLFHMRGNVFEMLETKGLAAGGSYLTEFEELTNNPIQKYKTPRKDLGFRTICEIQYQ